MKEVLLKEYSDGKSGKEALVALMLTHLDPNSSSSFSAAFVLLLLNGHPALFSLNGQGSHYLRFLLIFYQELT